MFSHEDLVGLVKCATRALREEEQLLTDRISDHWNFGDVSGLMCNPHEHYFQYLIWRELLRNSQWRPHTEQQMRSDLVFRNNETDKIVAIAEIKCWWNDGPDEIQRISWDIEKLRIFGPAGAKKVMLVLTTYQVDGTDWFDHLAKELDIARADIKVGRFDNSERQQGSDPWEFAVGAFFVN